MEKTRYFSIVIIVILSFLIVAHPPLRPSYATTTTNNNISNNNKNNLLLLFNTKHKSKRCFGARAIHHLRTHRKRSERRTQRRRARFHERISRMKMHNFSNMLPARRRRMCRQEGWSNTKGPTSSSQRDQRPNILSITGHKPNSEVGMIGGPNDAVRRVYTGASKRPSGKPRPRSGMVRPVAYILSNNSKVHDDGLSPASDTAIDPHKKYNSTNNAVLSNQNAPTSRSAHSGVYSSAGSQVTIGRQINIATNAKKTRNTFETYLRARTAMRNKKRRPKVHLKLRL